MLLDEVLPEFHVRASYDTQVVASPERVYASIWTADFDHWGLMRVLFMLRGLPGLLAAPRETWRRVRAQGGRRRVLLGLEFCGPPGQRRADRPDDGDARALRRSSDAATVPDLLGGDRSLQRPHSTGDAGHRSGHRRGRAGMIT
jgi:hypothetical protein